MVIAAHHLHGQFGQIKEKKSGQGTTESYAITWKFFKQMMFLEQNIQHTTSSTSTLQLESGDTQCSIVDFSVPSSSPQFSGRPRLRTPAPSPSPSAGSSSSQAISILNSAVSALQSSDTNSTFCDNLLAELRTLSEQPAQKLRYKISRTMMDFMEENGETTPVNQNGQENDAVI